MLFKGEDTSLQLDVVSYELPAGEGDPNSDDRNWLVLRATWQNEDGDIVKDTNSCLLTYELREMTAGLKVLSAGIKDWYASSFVEPYFELAAQARGERVAVLEARRHYCWYLKGVSHSGYYKEQIVQMNTLEDVERVTKGIKRDLK